MARVNTGLRRSDFQEGKLVRTNFNGKSIVVAGERSVGPLGEGLLEGYEVECPSCYTF
jgi:hypothetical protein